jgi:hypothetical protein
MRTTAVLAFLLCLTLRLISQELGKPQAQAQCKFSDGSTIRVTHISERKTYELATDEDLLTVKGMSVPAGHYAVLPAKDPRNDSWTLKMRSESAKGESRELPPVPMSVIRRVMLKRLEPSALSVVTFTVSFNQTGGSCMMHWRSDKPNMMLSLEFTEKNTDLPLAR